MTFTTRALPVCVLVAVISAACSDERAPLFAPQFGVITGPTVSGVSPDSAQQGATLDITVDGSGFDKTTRVDLGMDGVPSSSVTTNKTTYVNPRRLIANITISDQALPTDYDVIATAADGKKGIGTDMFKIKTRPIGIDVSPTWYLSNDVNLGMRADDSFLEPNGTSRYKPAECGVDARIFTSNGSSGDATLTTAASRDTKCKQYPRRIRIAYAVINADGTTTSEGSWTGQSFLNVRKLQTKANGTVVSYVPVGTTQTRTMAFSDESNKCGAAGAGAILFSAVNSDGLLTGADSVQVTRVAADTWEVFTAPDEVDAITGQTVHHDRAWCRANGKVYHMPLRATIKSPVSLP
jgi:hypothetical protein